MPNPHKVLEGLAVCKKTRIFCNTKCPYEKELREKKPDGTYVFEDCPMYDEAAELIRENVLSEEDDLK